MGASGRLAALEILKDCKKGNIESEMVSMPGDNTAKDIPKHWPKTK